MQETRLFKIVYYLLGKGQATAPELAKKFEVSARTIYRDIDALSGAGIPIYTETGRNGGIYLMDGFVLDKTILSKEEKQEILTAVQSINAMQNTSSQALQKLSAMFCTSQEEWIEIDFSRWGNKGSDNEKFDFLKRAILNHKAVKIHYADTYGVIGERTVWPLKLYYKAKAWYLKAFCTKRQDFRLFKLNRILELSILDKSFSCHSFKEPPDSTDKEGEIQVILRFPEEVAYRVYDEFDKTQIQRQEDGSLIVSAKMPEDKWLTGFLLSFGALADIISPIRLKEAVAKQAKLIYEKNKT
ncbi:MAG: YafY family transcriptional regulator [Lachnospiraceae bacterium]